MHRSARPCPFLKSCSSAVAGIYRIGADRAAHWSCDWSPYWNATFTCVRGVAANRTWKTRRAVEEGQLAQRGNKRKSGPSARLISPGPPPGTPQRQSGKAAAPDGPNSSAIPSPSRPTEISAIRKEGTAAACASHRVNRPFLTLRLRGSFPKAQGPRGTPDLYPEIVNVIRTTSKVGAGATQTGQLKITNPLPSYKVQIILPISVLTYSLQVYPSKLPPPDQR